MRRLTLDALQQRSDVLVDVMIARALPKILGVLVVVTQREISDLCQVFRIQSHSRSVPHTRPACTRIGSPQRGRGIVVGYASRHALLTKPVNWPRPGRSMRHEHRDGQSSQHAAGDTAKYELAQTRVAVAAHHNEIHVLISRMGE